MNNILHDNWFESNFKIIINRVSILSWDKLSIYLEVLTIRQFLCEENHFDKYIEELLNDIFARSNGNDDLWSHAVILFSNKNKLKDMLINDLNKNSAYEKDYHVSYFKTILKNYLIDAKREWMASGKDYSSAKIATWERIYKIHLQLSSDYNDLYNDEYLLKMIDYITTNFPNDKNLPRTVKTIREYVNEFKPQLTVDITDESFQDLYQFQHFSQSDVDLYMPDLLPIMMECVEQTLNSEHQKIVYSMLGEDDNNQIFEGSLYIRNKIFQNEILDLLYKCIQAKAKGVI